MCIIWGFIIQSDRPFLCALRVDSFSQHTVCSLGCCVVCVHPVCHMTSQELALLCVVCTFWVERVVSSLFRLFFESYAAFWIRCRFGYLASRSICAFRVFEILRCLSAFVFWNVWIAETSNMKSGPIVEYTCPGFRGRNMLNILCSLTKPADDCNVSTFTLS